jgi:hypothetical protein
VFVSCAAGGVGEDIQLAGTLHSVVHLTISNSGNFRYKEQFQPQGASGTGATTGDSYRGNGITQTIDHVGFVGETFTYVNNFRMIGTGPGNNFTVHENVHTTVNANGTLTASVDNFRADCS